MGERGMGKGWLVATKLDWNKKFQRGIAQWNDEGQQ